MWCVGSGQPVCKRLSVPLAPQSKSAGHQDYRMSTDDDDRMNEAKAWLNNQALTVGYYCLLTVSACDCPYCLHRAACIAHMPTATVSSPQNLVVFLSDRRPLAVTLTQCNLFTCVQYVHATSEDWQLSGLWSLWTQV